MIIEVKLTNNLSTENILFLDLNNKIELKGNISAVNY
jgi:hypothetical protein